MTSFEERLRNFIRSCPDCEILDDGTTNVEGEVADFLLNHRNVVAELKCLEEDTLAKLQQFATELIESRNLDVYGQVPFERIIELQSDKSDLKTMAFKKIGGDRLQVHTRPFRHGPQKIEVTNMAGAVLASGWR